MAESKTSPRRLKAKERALEASKLKMAGASLENIGKQLGITRQAVHQLLEKYYSGIEAEAIANLTQERRLDLDRLDRLLLAYWPKALSGDYKAASMVRGFMEDRRSILGYAAPSRAELSGPDGVPLANGPAGVFVLPMAPTDAQAWTAEALKMSEGEEATATKLLDDAENPSDDAGN